MITQLRQHTEETKLLSIKMFLMTIFADISSCRDELCQHEKVLLYPWR